jgi:hypothetical protein
MSRRRARGLCLLRRGADPDSGQVFIRGDAGNNLLVSQDVVFGVPGGHPEYNDLLLGETSRDPLAVMHMLL